MEIIPESSYNGRMEFRRQSNATYKCEYHLVLTSKYRKKIFNPGVLEYFKIKIEEIKQYYPHLDVLEINHGDNHIHMLIVIPPKMSVGSVVRVIKSNTAKSLRDKFQYIREAYWGTESVWSEGYFVSTVGLNEKVIRAYIEKQGEEDSGQAKLELG